MTAKYDKTRHVLVEQPEIEPPMPNDASDSEKYKGPFALWNTHLASLRELACVPGSVWEEDKIYEEGKDYEIGCSHQDCDCDSLTGQQKYCSRKVLVAAPIPKQYDLWSQVINFYNDKRNKGVVRVDIIRELETLYNIIKKPITSE